MVMEVLVAHGDVQVALPSGVNSYLFGYCHHHLHNGIAPGVRVYKGRIVSS